VVSVQGKQRYMGDEAAAIMKSNFKNTPMNIKRLLGRQFKEPEVFSLHIHHCVSYKFII
jgi:molecular chaperone DnaK (HSP70)